MTQKAFVAQPGFTYFIPAKTQLYGAFTATGAPSTVVIQSIDTNETATPFLFATITSSTPLVIDSGLFFADGRTRPSTNGNRQDKGFQLAKNYYALTVTASTLLVGVSNLSSDGPL
jgi:hypothetical protein